MKNHVYKLIELTGTSGTSIEDAAAKAIQRAHKTIKNLGWFQVIETRQNQQGKGGAVAGDHQSRFHCGRLSEGGP
jgi:flavin-binding protein dodecin